MSFGEGGGVIEGALKHLSAPPFRALLTVQNILAAIQNIFGLLFEFSADLAFFVSRH